MAKLLYFIFLFPLIVFSQSNEAELRGQERGIHFEVPLNWENILEKAKKENKYIFLECYTTWCGPCKFMKKMIFSQDTVGVYFNEHFINVALQMDKTPKDPAEIQQLYGLADTMARRYKIDAYPSFIFFSPEGRAIHRAVGAASTGRDFLAIGRDVFDPNKQYYTVLSQWTRHQGDSISLLQSVKLMVSAEDMESARLIGQTYLNSLTFPITQMNIRLFSKLIISSSDRFYELFIRNSEKVNKIMGDSVYTQSLLASIIFREKVAPLLNEKSSIFYWSGTQGKLRSDFKSLGEGFIQALSRELDNYIYLEISGLMREKNNGSPDWAKIYNRLNARYPGYNWYELYLIMKVKYCGENKEWRNCQAAAFKLFNKFGKHLGSGTINYISWSYLFLHCDDSKILFQALKCMKDVINRGPDKHDFNNFDTYANLLYKAGRKEEALIWEKRAIDTLVSRDPNSEYISEFKADLEKMKTDKPTWENTSDEGL